MKRLFMIAAVMLLAIGCSDYNDSELRGRVDELEDKVDSHEKWLENLDSQIKSMNEANKAFTALLNGGLITNVTSKNENGKTGYEITITRADGTTEKYVVWNGTNGTNGTNGANGENGANGHSPVLTVKQDTDGRWYWCLDGVAMDDGKGGKVYATGDKGATGAAGVDGVTPELKVALGDKEPGDVEDGEMSWWVSYDKGETWHKLAVVAGDVSATAGVAIEFDEVNGKVIFTQGEQSWAFDYNVLGMSFSIDGEAVEAYSTVRMSVEESVEIEVAVEGASKNAVVKAELQNPGHGFEVFVSDNVITVDAVAAGSNKLLVEVQDGANCYHSWIDLFVAPNAWIEVAGLDDYHYLPVAFAGDRAISGMDFSYLNNVPAELDVTLNLDAPAPKDITVDVVLSEVFADDGDTFLGEGVVNVPSSITVKKGQSSVKIPFTLNRAKLICDAYTYVEIVSDELNVEEGCDIWFANNFTNKIALKAENYECVFDASASGEGQGIPALFDNNPATMLGTAYWKTDEMDTFADQIAVFGVYVDITLPVNVAAVQFEYQNRAGKNGQPRALKFGADNGNGYTVIGTMTDGFVTENSGWNKTGVYVNSGLMKDIRFGVTSSETQQMNDLTTNPAGSMTLAELYVNVMY